MTDPSAELRTLTAEELAQWRQLHDDLTIIDVRSPAEFETLHIHGSYNVPLPLLTEHASDLAERLGHRAVLVCQSGNRATQAQQHLAAHAACGRPTCSPAACPPSRPLAARWSAAQLAGTSSARVRFTAGLIVLVSLLVAEFLWPESRFIAFALSAGLVVAALTGSCLMGRILSRMPWNKVTASPTARSAIASIPVATQEL